MSNYRYHCSFHEYKNSYANLVMNLAATLIRLSITGLELSSPVPSLSPDLGPSPSTKGIESKLCPSQPGSKSEISQSTGNIFEHFF